MVDHPDAAELYDRQHADADRGDAAFYRDLATSLDGSTLELACGTGRVHLELLAAGVDADGIDLDADSLDRLRAKADERGLDPSVWQADMLEFDADRAYDLVICPFNTVQHAKTVADQRQLLETVHDALAPGGRFVFDTFVPGFDVICETYGEWREQAIEHEGRTYTHRTRARVVDQVEQQFEVENVTESPDGVVVHEASHRLSMLPKQQVELLARDSPFAAWSVEAGFDGGELTPEDTVQVWTLEKAE